MYEIIVHTLPHHEIAAPSPQRMGETSMGDRVTLAVQDQGERVYLYSHWGGWEMPETLRVAIARRQRWDDPSYLTRIIFNTMTLGSEGDETGYGISTRVQDYEYPLLVVDCDKKEIRLEKPEGGQDYHAPSATHTPIGFEEYASATERSWHSLDPDNERFKPDDPESD